MGKKNLGVNGNDFNVNNYRGKPIDEWPDTVEFEDLNGTTFFARRGTPTYESFVRMLGGVIPGDNQSANKESNTFEPKTQTMAQTTDNAATGGDEAMIPDEIRKQSIEAVEHNMNTGMLKPNAVAPADVKPDEEEGEVIVDESMSESAGGDEGLAMNDEGLAISDKGNGGEAAGGSASGGANGAAGGDAGEAAGEGNSGFAGGGSLVVPKVEGLPDPNHYSGSAGKSATKTAGESERSSESVGTSRVRIDEPTYQELYKNHFNDLMGRTRASIINELFGGDLDPAKAEREKADADRRRRRHEGVEAVRLLIEGFTGAGHGRIIKRDKANYQRYEDEKNKVDATRKAALEKLYAAMAADDEMARNIKFKLMEMAKVSEQKQSSNGKESRTGSSETTQSNLSAGGGSSNSGDGKKSGGDDYTLTYQEVGDDNKGTGRRVVVRFGGEKAYKSYMSEAANVITQSANIGKADDVVKRYKGKDGKIHNVKRGIGEDTLLYRCMQMAVKVNGISKEQTKAAQQVSDILLTGYYTPEDGAQAVPAWKLREQMIRSVTNQNQAMRDLLNRYSGTDGTNIKYYKSADSTPADTFTEVDMGEGDDLE